MRDMYWLTSPSFGALCGHPSRVELRLLFVARTFAFKQGEGWPANRSSFIKEGAHRRAFHLRALRFGGQVGAMVGNLRLDHERRLVDQMFASWNRIHRWMRCLEALRQETGPVE